MKMAMLAFIEGIFSDGLYTPSAEIMSVLTSSSYFYETQTSNPRQNCNGKIQGMICQNKVNGFLFYIIVQALVFSLKLVILMFVLQLFLFSFWQEFTVNW